MEIFKIIEEFPEYLISNCGRIKTVARPLRYVHAVTGKEHTRQVAERFLKVFENNRTGYKFIQPYKNKKPHTRTIHRLVAQTFIPNPDNLGYVNHKDGNKHNNTVENLEWCTNEYNHEHATRTGLLAKGSRIASSKLNERAVEAIKRMLKDGISHSQIGKWFGVSPSNITSINTGKTWNHI